MTLGKLVSALHAVGLQADLTDLRDMFWLASQIKVPPQRASPPPTVSPVTEGAKADVVPPPSSAAIAAAPPTELRSIFGRNNTEGSIFGDGPKGDGAAAQRVQLRGTPALPEALAIGRALRPLSRRRAGGRLELDERATAEFIAEAGMRGAVWRPALERWFDIVMAVEEVPSLAAWRPTVSEFGRLLRRQGGFRSVRTVGLRASDVGTRGMKAVAHDTHEVPIGALQERRGRCLVLVLTDCTSSAWRGGRVSEWLKVVSERSPVAVVQLLPQSLWPNTAIGFAELRVQSPRIGAPAAQLRVERPSWAQGEPGVVIPVLALNPSSIKAWTRMVAALGDAWSSASLLPLPEDGLGDETTPGPHHAPEPSQRASRFRASVTPDAQRLAAYFSIVRPLTAPVMRVIHHAMRPDSGAVALAQVFLGGLLHPVDPTASTMADSVEYEFYPGLREHLAKDLTGNEFIQVNLALHDFLQQLAGTPFDFFALIHDSGGEARLPEAALPFAQSARHFAKRFGLAQQTDALQSTVTTRPIAQLQITLSGTTLIFVHRSNRGELTLRHELARGAARWLKTSKDNLYGEFPMAMFAELVPYGLAEANAVVNGPDLIELLLDQQTQFFPWELLIRGAGSSGTPLAVSHGFIRNQSGEAARTPPVHPRPTGALVVGGWSSTTARGDSPDSRFQVDMVSKLLNVLEEGTVHSYSGEADVATAFFAEPGRVFYFSGQSQVGEPGIRLRSSESFSIGIDDFAKLSQMPELVFLACDFGASMALELISLGARVVVGYLGKVSDTSVNQFVTSFFGALSSGAPVIEALRVSRQLCWSTAESDQAWGRFQCYGEAEWYLTDTGDLTRRNANLESVSPVPATHSVFLSFASADNEPHGGAPRGWATGLVEALRTWSPTLNIQLNEDMLSLARRGGASGLTIIPSHSERLLILMSKAYLNSERCRGDLQEFLLYSFLHRIIIIELEPTDRRAWHPELKKLPGLKFWDEQRPQHAALRPVDIPPSNSAENDDFFMGRLTHLLRALEKPADFSKPHFAPPKAWVLVAGTGRKNKLSSKLNLACEVLGRLLARANFGLVTGGWPGVDEAVARNYAAELDLMEYSTALEERLVHVMATGDEPAFPSGSLVHVTKGKAEYEECIRRARFVVLVGGAGGTLQIANLARDAGLVVLPLSDTGGDAKRYYKDATAMLETTDNAGLAPNLSAADFAALGSSVPEVINDLINILERLTLVPPSSPPSSA